jgi:uncharacterized membrane protein YkvA (DUF1232 family)
MEKPDPTLKKAKRKFILSLILFAGGVVYAIWPMDLIPDLLGPVGWIDDLTLLGISFANAANSYRRRLRAAKPQSRDNGSI